MKSALALILGILVLTLLLDNHALWYYGQYINPSAHLLRMAADAFVILALFVGGMKIQDKLKVQS
jgi:hypothetical protein